MKEKLAKLIDVKSLMTLALTAGFIGLDVFRRSIRTGIHEHFHYDCGVLFRNPGRESKKIEREEEKMSVTYMETRMQTKYITIALRKRRN